MSGLTMKLDSKLVLASLTETMQQFRIVLDLDGHDGPKTLEHLYGQFIACVALEKLLRPTWSDVPGMVAGADRLAEEIAADFERARAEKGRPS